jgi:hypothetical protein
MASRVSRAAATACKYTILESSWHCLHFSRINLFPIVCMIFILPCALGCMWMWVFQLENLANGWPLKWANLIGKHAVKMEK